MEGAHILGILLDGGPTGQGLQMHMGGGYLDNYKGASIPAKEFVGPGTSHHGKLAW